MGKIKINGSAKKEFKADVMSVNLSISTSGETSASAIMRGKKETEKLLRLLVDMGIDLGDVTMKGDRVSEPSRYNDDDLYHFSKEIVFAADANLATLELLSSGIISEEINTTYSETFCLSDTASAHNEVLQEALLDAKKKAEEIAKILGQKVIGIEEARCDAYEDDEPEEVVYKMSCAGRCEESLASKLSPDTVSIARSIDVIWNIE